VRRHGVGSENSKPLIPLIIIKSVPIGSAGKFGMQLALRGRRRMISMAMQQTRGVDPANKFSLKELWTAGVESALVAHKAIHGDDPRYRSHGV
jgi:hypothetical protein